MPAPTTAADGTVVLETGEPQDPARRSSRTSSATGPGATTDHDRRRRRSAGRPVPLTISAWSDDAAWGERVGDLVGARAAGPGRRGSGSTGRATGGLDIRESVGRVERRLRRPVRPGDGPDRRRLRRERRGRPARGRPRLVQRRRCWPTAGRPRRFASYYARVAAPELEVTTSPDADADTIPADLEAARIPLNAWGAARQRGRDRPRTTRTRRRSRSPGRSASGSATTGCRRSGRMPRRRTGAYQPPARLQASGDARDRRRPARLARPARPARRARVDVARRPVADLGRATGRSRPARRARGGPRPLRRRRRDRPATGSCREPVRDAMRAWRFDDADALLTEAETILAQRTAIATAPPRPG